MKVIRHIDLANQTFGILKVIKRVGINQKNRCALWLTKCDCGNESIVSSNSLRTGKTKSCGCKSIINLEKGRARKGKRPECSGEKSHLWKGGIYPKHLAIRKSLEYKEWRKSVFIRDNYTCQNCGQYGGQLNADHIIPFCVDENLRFDLNNGRTLCVLCHRKTDTYGHKSNILKNKINAGLLA